MVGIDLKPNAFGSSAEWDAKQVGFTPDKNRETANSAAFRLRYEQSSR